MIQANELRIGNKILCDGKMATVANLFPDNIRVKEKSIYEQASHESMYEPIPLTPETLEKAGFEYQHDQTGMCYYCKNVYMFFDGEYLSANFGHIKRLDVEVKYLHQLQNLYFTLTGTELEINL